MYKFDGPVLRTETGWNTRILNVPEPIVQQALQDLWDGYAVVDLRHGHVWLATTRVAANCTRPLTRRETDGQYRQQMQVQARGQAQAQAQAQAARTEVIDKHMERMGDIAHRYVSAAVTHRRGYL